MRKVALALLLTAVGLGLLLSFKSRAASANSALGGSALSGGTSSNAGARATTGSSPGPTPTTSAPAGASASPSASAPAGKAGAKNGSYTGTAEITRYGYVQVQAVISGGKLTNVVVLQVPDHGGYEDQIVQIALPELKSEALSAQSAHIDIISGATYTSQGYAQSLQSALDQAGL
ncbi:FMN-binding protein [Actinospica sp. MGRD01-02]|uniref:FMN-binding protein n=1 Tax=Actinospica acidithermotolerans TaxID=2828514 RepID=A0A941EEE3_9ACTN|nr:FMN-binding protein [Actinospica acidithermotolerans]MBR7828888.1 FMN-binding protein [Actinospica acidithermotolerans]